MPAPVAMPACSAEAAPNSGFPLMKNSTEASGRESQRQKAAVTCGLGCAGAGEVCASDDYTKQSAHGGVG